MPKIRILVVSDVHGEVQALRWILRHEQADAMFFLGDGARDLDNAIALEQEQKHPLRWPVYRVRGNCDAGCPDPIEALAPFGGVLFFYTHGHAYGVKMGSERLAETAAARGADVALYGHTHDPDLERALAGRPAVFNPGALLRGSYGVITLEDGQRSFGWRRVPPL